MVSTAVMEKATSRPPEKVAIDRFGPVPVQRLWPSATVVCIGTGPSLTQEDVNACRGHARVIAIKNAVTMASWADCVYGAGNDAGGRTWWSREGPGLQFNGLRYSLDPNAARWSSVLRQGSETGLSSDPWRLALGRHSGYQAINLAVLLGAARVVLLGYDMQPTGGKEHYFGAHPHGVAVPFDYLRARFDSIVEPLQAAGVIVLNASRETALTIFPRVSLEEALAS